MPITLSFGKIAGTPTSTAWSQAYAAGNLFVAISLEAEQSSDPTLQVQGKSFVNSLEAEFFTLAQKDLDHIKQAVIDAIREVPENTNLSCALLYHKEGVFYLVLVGGGMILIKRKEETAPLLTREDAAGRELSTASGKALPSDRILLATTQFLKTISQETLHEALSLKDLEESVEMLQPLIHKEENGGSGAVLIEVNETNYVVNDPTKQTPSPEEPEDEETIEDVQTSLPIHTPGNIANEELTTQRINKTNSLKTIFSSLSTLPFLKNTRQLTHRRKVILSIALILLIVFIGSIFLAVRESEARESRAIFASTYPEALENYEKGQGLADLNQPLAKEELTRAKKQLEDALPKLQRGSNEYKKAETLLAEVESLLKDVSDENALAAEEVDSSKAPLLELLTTNGSLFATRGEDYSFVLFKDKVTKTTNNQNDQETIIENDNDWENPKGLGTFGGNVYILDPENGVLKFSGSGTSYTKSSYFPGDGPNLSKAVGLAIDSSVYIVFSDGAVMKFIRGASDTFTMKGLPNPLKNPKRILTSADHKNVYVLDSGNGRVVQFSKDGEYQTQYVSGVFKNAQDFTVDEAGRRIYVLLNGTFYELPLSS